MLCIEMNSIPFIDVWSCMSMFVTTPNIAFNVTNIYLSFLMKHFGHYEIKMLQLLSLTK